MMLFLTTILLFSTGAIAQYTDEAEIENGPLDLTAYLERGEADKARELSAVDPTLFAGVQSHAAFFNVNKTNKWHTFFWFFPAENKPLDSTPWIIWLQGGPGYSSLFGLFLEIGPLEVKNGTVSRMPITWNNDYSLLFIDNPVDVGFSYSESKDNFVSNEDEVGECLVSFIQQFVQVFPELQKAPLFIAGESYGGKYVPAFGYYLHYYRDMSIPINLKGLIIADGWTDPPSLLHFSELAMQFGFWDFDRAAEIKALEDAARTAWEDGNFREYSKKYNEIKDAYENEIPNMYNIAHDKDKEPAAYFNFLNQSEVRNALHVGNAVHSFGQNMEVRRHFEDDFFMSVKPWLEDLLENYGVLCFNGQLDFVVGYALAEHMYRNLNWSGAQDFLKANRTTIPSEYPGQTLDPIGYVKAAGNFMEVMIRTAGHMAPADQPRASKQVLDMFIEKFK